MLSERIFFIIERISDILNVDNERNQILTLCQNLSHDERMAFLELYSDYAQRKILEFWSDDKIKEILKFYSNDKIKDIKEILEIYSDDKIEYLKEDLKFYSDEEIQNSSYYVRMEFIDFYLPGDKRKEFLKMYRKLSGDDKQEFLNKYDDSWRYKILKYLKIRQRWIHKHHVGTFFDILTLLIEGKEVVLSKDVKEGIGELRKGLWHIYHYVRDVEAKYDDSQMLSEYEPQLYHNLSYIAHSSDDILDHIMSNDVTHQIHTLLETIHNFYTYNLSSTGTTSLLPNMKVVVKNNINSGGHQSLANMNFSINRSIPLKDKQNSRPKTYGHVPNSHLVGFNHEIQILLNNLIQSHDETKVVGIVGPGGAGKTTLAKHIYHHPKINSHFAIMVWVCISQSWDKTTILNSIWRQAYQKPEAPEMGYDQLLDRLSKLLHSKSYLVIMDDIWSVDAWYDISPALSPNTGSKVVVTTRNKSLPKHIDPGVLIVEPKLLSYEECYELFKKRALLDENVHHELLPLGKEMVKKCKGLPLAVVALAGVLVNDKRLSSWERISKRVTDKMLNMKNDSTQGVVKEILALSYYQLPDYLKPCALYLHLFPEDRVIEAQQVIEMWIAECFMDEEDEAEEYLDELAQRSIVEVVQTNHKEQVHRFRIHDLIREMFINIDKERGILKNQELRVTLRTTTLYRDIQEHSHSRVKVPEKGLYEISHARSLICFSFRSALNKLELLFIEFKLLRVLIISRIYGGRLLRGEMLPGEIGNLIHLRYLELNGRSELLPRSIENLENLLTLNLGNLYGDRDGTINLEKLKELRHLYMPYCKMLGLEKLKKLKTLRISKAGMWMSVLPKLGHVLQELCIRAIVKETELEMVFRTPSIVSNKLHTLELYWKFQVGDMSMMSKCKSITKLELNGRIREGTPLMFPPNLIHLKMAETCVEEKQVMNIISNSCPLLKFLFLERDAYKGTELICNENSFPRLEKLELRYLEVMWIIERGAMPRLNHLSISDCSLLDINEEGWERISKIPNLTIGELRRHLATTSFGKKLQQWRKDWIHCVKEVPHAISNVEKFYRLK